jgi:aryl-alcohol dehydrogenase-like predicted oxidoreductase
MPTPRLVLGTAQLGMHYGVANRTGKPDFETALAIVKIAWENGINEFDTAQAYGESEAVLGRILSILGIANEAKIITKVNPELKLRGRSLKTALDESLERLQISALFGLMLHRENWLDDLNNGLGNILQDFVRRGLVGHVGVSLYSPARAVQALQSEIFDMVQVPANMLDRRFGDAGIFTLADSQGKQVYIRSVFLQGLLLMSPAEVPAGLDLIKPALANIDKLCAQYGFSRQKMALLYIKRKYPKAKIIIGAETPEQLEQNLNIWEDLQTLISDMEEFDNLPTADEKIINPAFWPKV